MPLQRSAVSQTVPRVVATLSRPWVRKRPLSSFAQSRRKAAVGGCERARPRHACPPAAPQVAAAQHEIGPAVTVAGLADFEDPAPERARLRPTLALERRSSAPPSP